MLMNFHRPSTALSYANVQRALLNSAAIAYVTLCSSRTIAHVPVAVSQILIVLSWDALAKKLAFGANFTSFTEPLWPFSFLVSEPLTNAPVPG